MKRINITEEEILQLPLTTNRLTIKWNKEAFFNRYAIVSYRMSGNTTCNLSYEQLSTVPALSVAGFYAKYEEATQHSYTRFFVLVKKGDENEVLHSLKAHENICARIDNLQEYSTNLQQRIVATLTINSLGKKRTVATLMYNNGTLFVCDDQNFYAHTKEELVCLQIEINPSMCLFAKTVTFTHPKSQAHLHRHSNCVFLQSKETGGYIWLGRSIKPVVIEPKTTYKLDELYVKGKRSKLSHNNIVPYWPWHKERYNKGKLFVLWQVVESINKEFKEMLHLDFTDHKVEYYTEAHTSKAILPLLNEYFNGKNIFINDSFNTPNSKKQIKLLQQRINNICQEVTVQAAKAPKSNFDMEICLCEPQYAQQATRYSQALDRMASSTKALQHVTHDDLAENNISEAMVKRILMELLVKDCNIKLKLPVQLCSEASGWTFYCWKLCEDNRVFGASLHINEAMMFKHYGFDTQLGEDFSDFIKNEIGYPNPQIIPHCYDYRALRKGDNLYLLIDTDEIPILDVQLIDDAYGKIINGEDNYKDAMFKRKADGTNHKYLRGYMGLHLWKSEPYNGMNTYSYIVGWNSDNINTTNYKIDKMPHARSLIVLQQGNTSTIENDIANIIQMLKTGLGRWNELSTYPFPFKFLQEYLDNQSEIVFSKHWSDM